MNTEELRDIIWDDLFRAKATKSFAEIATVTNCDVAAIGAAVDHEWFKVAENRVSIAYTATGVHAN